MTIFERALSKDRETDMRFGWPQQGHNGRPWSEDFYVVITVRDGSGQPKTLPRQYHLARSYMNFAICGYNFHGNGLPARAQPSTKSICGNCLKRYFKWAKKQARQVVAASLVTSGVKELYAAHPDEAKRAGQITEDVEACYRTAIEVSEYFGEMGSDDDLERWKFVADVLGRVLRNCGQTQADIDEHAAFAISALNSPFAPDYNPDDPEKSF